MTARATAVIDAPDLRRYYIALGLIQPGSGGEILARFTLDRPTLQLDDAGRTAAQEHITIGEHGKREFVLRRQRQE